MKRSLLAILLAVCLFLSACSADQTEAATPDIEPTATFDWMSGESPVPVKRIGVNRFGVNLVTHAISPDGIYFTINERYSENGITGTRAYIVYADHGSDTFVKLCGRIDCTHDNEDCNAYVAPPCTLSFYQGYLYAATGETTNRESKLIRMKPDGSDHEVILDLIAFAKDHGGDMVYGFGFAEGVYLFDTYHWVKQESIADSITLISEPLENYRYKVDGSEGEPKLRSGTPFYYCGDNPFALYHRTDESPAIGAYDLEKDEVTYLAEHPGVAGYYDKTAGYYYNDGAICRLDYTTNTEQIMAQTGLSGDYFLFVFPDCMVLTSTESAESADKNLYFYNWDYQLIDSVEITFSFQRRLDLILVAETAERIFLSSNEDSSPTHYIDKAELGTGNVQVHDFKYA